MAPHYQTGLKVATGKSVDEQKDKLLAAGRAKVYCLSLHFADMKKDDPLAQT